MAFTRIKFSKDVTNKLKNLKAKTGMDANIFCRIGLCYSLGDPKPVNPDEYDEDGQEISRITLLGDLEPLYIALVVQRCIKFGLDPVHDIIPQMRGHMNRGVNSISNRIKDLGDLASLLPASNGTALSNQNGSD